MDIVFDLEFGDVDGDGLADAYLAKKRDRAPAPPPNPTRASSVTQCLLAPGPTRPRSLSARRTGYRESSKKSWQAAFGT